MLKKIICLGIVAVMCLGAFSGCGSSHGIPNGKYVPTNVDKQFTLNQESTVDCYWLIKRDIAEYHVSGMRMSKCDIIVESDKLYFERCKDTDIKQENIFKYEVIYDESSKSITIYW